MSIAEKHQDRSSRRKTLKEQRPSQILEAAFAEFCEKGYAAARVEDVARRIGVTKGTVYLYFPTKEELFKAVVRAYLVPIFKQMQDIANTLTGSAKEALRKHLEIGYAEFGNERMRELLRLIIAEGARAPELVDFYLNEVMSCCIAPLRAILERGVKTGEFKPGSLEWLGQFPEILIGPAVVATVNRMVLGERYQIDVERYQAAHLDLILNGLCRTAARA